MEGKVRATHLFSFTISLLFLSSTALNYQTLVPKSLPSPPTLSWTESETLSFSEPDTNTTRTLDVELHHIDALSLNKTPQQLFNLRLQRDASRVKSLISVAEEAIKGSGVNVTRAGARGAGFSSSVISGLAQGSGEYFTRLGVGTPPRYVYMVLDTGSDVVWIQCAPCKKCYSQSDPVFDPRKSRSFAVVPCGSPLCRKLDSPGCNQRVRKCLYQVSYGDGSFTVGDFSTETLTFRGTRVGRVALGCGHDNEGLFVGAAGLLGLGRGKLSFPRQAGIRFNRKFSYCLVDRSASSRPSSMVFGDAAISRTARFTPLVANPKLETFYYLELLGMSVGGTRVSGISPSLFKLDPTGNGGVIVDSGTSVTRLTRPAYIALRNAFRIGASNLKRAPEFSLFDTCFDLSGKTEVKVPTVVMHFRGADVALPASNYLIPVDSSSRFCFAFAGTMSGLSIIGNIQQQGFRVVYDLAGSRVGFAPRGCA
ncbi:aspartyl protease family protein 2-like [Tripterygium wilfordii]|uniref:aspartyl protease family protein 2-like n=1 Tax=Tripterygium wilfordii TaxID=458696 RepID=UPI0018F81055|nr:aspartyl protease family protein 2-like [Tripterygium wilfordii]